MRLRDGRTVQDPRLDALPSQTEEHLRKYPFQPARASSYGVTTPVPVLATIPWYEAYDHPVKGRDGRWRVPTDDLGQLRGWHGICLLAKGFTDADSWHRFYNQGEEGRCEQFALSRIMSLLRRKRYEVRAGRPMGRWLYYEAQKGDEWPGGEYPGASPQYAGTSGRAVMEVARSQGLIVVDQSTVRTAEGISAYRWALDVPALCDALGRPEAKEIPMLNSWGERYPRVVWSRTAHHARFYVEGADYGIVTKR